MRKHIDDNPSDKRPVGQKSIYTFERPSSTKVEKDSNINTFSISSSSASDNQTLIAHSQKKEIRHLLLKV